jgi:hypothetical protein
MKNMWILTTVAFVFCGIQMKAQTKQDSLAVEKACRDYVEGWATGDAERVARGVSPELVKRTVGQDKEGVCYTNNMSASLLFIATKGNKEGVRGKDLEPDKPFKLDVMIFDMTADYALVKTANTKYGFFDYCQLARFNGEWKIFNVLWGWLPKR